MTADATDLAAVRADDALLDVLGGRTPELAPEAVSDELSGLLLALRHDADRPLVGELVSTRRAVRLFRRARWARRLARILPTRRSTR